VGVVAAVLWEYWDGTTWQTLSTSGAGDGLDADGAVTFTVPVDWATKSVNSSDMLYYIRVSAGTVTTPPTCNCVRQNGVKDTDYYLDAGSVTPNLLAGRIGRIAAAMFADGEAVKVSYTYTTWTSLRFPIATASFLEGAARLECKPSSGRGLQWQVHIPKCQVKPGGNITLDDTKWVEIPFELEILDDTENNPTAPFGYYEALSET
jgi:hypothetical protein